MKKKFSWLLVLSLVLSLVPATALLAEEYVCGEDCAAECEYCALDCEYCAEAAEENGEEADENGEDADENGEDAEENGEAAEENGDEADENGDEADENGDEADADDADEAADYAYDEDDYLPAPIVEIVPITAELTTELRFVIGDVVYTRNGVNQPELDVAPFIDAAAGRTMVPLRAVSEGLGATVIWNGEARNVTIIRGDVNLVINVDSELPDGMGSPTIIDGRTFVPLAYVSEQLGATVNWDSANQAVYVQE